MTEVRPRLTEIVDDARDRDLATALTEYGRPRAFVVSVPFFERAERDAAVIERLRGEFPDLFETLTQGIPSSVVPQKLPKG
jgi:hypothetical protein